MVKWPPTMGSKGHFESPGSDLQSERIIEVVEFVWLAHKMGWNKNAK